MLSRASAIFLVALGICNLVQAAVTLTEHTTSSGLAKRFDKDTCADVSQYATVKNPDRKSEYAICCPIGDGKDAIWTPGDPGPRCCSKPYGQDCNFRPVTVKKCATDQEMVALAGVNACQISGGRSAAGRAAELELGLLLLAGLTTLGLSFGLS